MTATIEQIRYANRVRELSRMPKRLLIIEEQRVMVAKGYRRIYGGPGSKDELISSILDLEGLNP